MNDDENPVIRYYNRTESRIGYQFFLKGTRHFGLYEPGQSKWAFSEALRRMEDELASTLCLPEGSRVLDAGCGFGDVARRLASVHGLSVVGIDLLDSNVNEAKNRAEASGLSARLSFLVMDYSQITLESESFEGVFTMETLVHATSAQPVLEEFIRVLKPGGRLALFEYSREPVESTSESTNAAFERISDLAAMPSFQEFDHGVLGALMTKVGFQDVKVRDVTPQILPMVHAFSLIGRLPYAAARALNKVHKLVNAMSAVEFWRHRSDFRYSIFSANKPK